MRGVLCPLCCALSTPGCLKHRDRSVVYSHVVSGSSWHASITSYFWPLVLARETFYCLFTLDSREVEGFSPSMHQIFNFSIYYFGDDFQSGINISTWILQSTTREIVRFLWNIPSYFVCHTWVTATMAHARARNVHKLNLIWIIINVINPLLYSFPFIVSSAFV